MDDVVLAHSFQRTHDHVFVEASEFFCFINSCACSGQQLEDLGILDPYAHIPQDHQGCIMDGLKFVRIE